MGNEPQSSGFVWAVFCEFRCLELTKEAAAAGTDLHGSLNTLKQLFVLGLLASI
jgi:hypothetical protein